MYRTSFDKSNKIWSGARSSVLYHRSLSLGQAILWNLKSSPNKISQINVDSGISLTNEDLHIKTIRAAQNLQKLGFQKSDVFCLIANNSHHVAPIVFASLCIGCPVNALDTAFSKTEILHMLRITKPKLVFCNVGLCESVRRCLTELQNDASIYTFGGSDGKSTAVEDLFVETGNEFEFTPREVDAENDIAIIVCSSGTTGLQKAVCLSHAVLMNQLMFTFNFTEDDIIMSFSSLYWLTGVIVLILGTFFRATRINSTEGFKPQLLLKIIEDYKVTQFLGAIHVCVATAKCKEIATTDLSSVRHFIVGGSRAPIEICKEMSKYLPNGQVNIAYGLSELGALASVHLPFMGRDSVGKLTCNMKVKIVDENGHKCDIGEDGEVRIKSKYRFLGYYGNEAATKQAIDSEGFLLTGDIGHFDEEGFLYVTDRKKDMLKYCNSQISPSEIESFLVRIPSIHSACVVGISDISSNDLPAAVIVKDDIGQTTENEIDKSVCENFADCKRLRGGIYFIDALPMTPSGKVLRRKVKEIAEKLHRQQFK